MRQVLVRRTPSAIAAVVTILVGPAAVLADETRITIGVRPGQANSPVTFGITSSGSRHTLPSVSFAGNRSGIQLSGYSTPLPLVAIRGLAVSPRYGDHRLAFDFQPAGLAGFGISPRSVRGLMLATTGKRISGALLVGRLTNGGAESPLESAIPRVAAFSGTIKPHRRVAISPRAVAPLSRTMVRGGSDPALGLGMRADLSAHVSLIGDVGNTYKRENSDQRGPEGRWAGSAVAGLLGRWSRGSFEASASHGDQGVTLLGSLPFAALDRTLAIARFLIVKGFTVEGQLGAFRPVRRQRDGTIQRAATFRVDRAPFGNVVLQLEGSRTRGRAPRASVIEWRQRGGAGLVFRLHDRDEGTGLSTARTRRLQIDTPALQTADHHLSLGFGSSVLLSERRVGDSRTATHLKGHVAAGHHFALNTEADLQLLSKGPVRHLSKLTTSAQVLFLRASSIQITHVYVPHDRTQVWKRLEIQFIKTLAPGKA